MSYSLTGTLHEVFPTQQVSEKFSKREFVVEVQDGQYPEHIKFQLVQDKTSLIDKLRTGDQVKVEFNLRGRGFNKNGQTLWFTNLEAWRIESTAPATQNQNPALQRQQYAAPIADEANDLPF